MRGARGSRANSTTRTKPLKTALGTRKRFKIDDSIDCAPAMPPLQARSTNVPLKRENGKPRRAEDYKKRRVGENSVSTGQAKTSVFDNEHVGLRLVDTPRGVVSSQVALPPVSAAVAAATPPRERGRPRQLKIKTTGLAHRELFLDADRSMQLDEFDQPPDSTSTPLLGSPGSSTGYSRPSSQLGWQEGPTPPRPWVTDPVLPDGWPHDPPIPNAWFPGTLFPGAPPGYAYVPIAIPTGRSSLSSHESPLKHRGAVFCPQPPPIYSGAPTLEARPWYAQPALYRPTHVSRYGNHESAQGLRAAQNAQDAIQSTQASQSYKSSGGDATCRSSTN
ncbi:LAQU0S11e03620g1_1 [Lachancea quebecensis]|uniref:LAQU0S11e03620g1_1 n=1 Tax=Lachancea quebecensis TaxID=1654605 RepID=A0A0P1KV19_9SACH|nr:LAQU0S11e03620g1_1 [Lachancea quebecensis]